MECICVVYLIYQFNHMTLHDYQYDAINKIKLSGRIVTIQLPTGSGKTGYVSKYYRMFTGEFQSEVGEFSSKDFDCDSLEDATIEASAYAEQEGFEMLSIDYTNKNL